MELRVLGRTRHRVSRLGLGLAALGRPGYINVGHAEDLDRCYDVELMRERTHAVLDAAWVAGVRYFDAARSYGRAEEFLASWLAKRGIVSAAVTVGSKWGYTYTAGWRTEAEHHEVKDHSLAVLERQIGESRAVLGTHLDLYQIHSATLESGVLENPAVLGSLAQLRRQGLSIGLSVSGPRQAETLRLAMQVAVDGQALFDCVQATWNLLERSAGDALAEAHRAGMGVIIKEGLANGRLTARYNDRAFDAKRDRLRAVAAELGVSVDGLALAAILAQPWVDVVLSGAATVEHLASNLSALRVVWNEAVSRELEPLIETPTEYWSSRGRLPWN